MDLRWKGLPALTHTGFEKSESFKSFRKVKVSDNCQHSLTQVLQQNLFGRLGMAFTQTLQKRQKQSKLRLEMESSPALTHTGFEKSESNNKAFLEHLR